MSVSPSVRTLDCLLDAAPAAIRTVRGVRAADWPVLRDALPAADAAWAKANGFEARPGQVLRLPGPDGTVAGALLGLGSGPAPFGGLAAALAEPGTVSAWRLDLPPDASAEDAVLGFCLGAYRFDRLRRADPEARGTVRLLRPEGAAGEGEAIARATWLARDLINLPPNLLGPADLAEHAAAALRDTGARLETVSGAALAERYPAVAAVGAGSAREARVVVARWQGSAAAPDAPLLSLCGKGVCFDTGGYDLKQPAGMLRMKKDMGGAAICLALARLVIDRDLPLRLELRLGCVENSVSGHAMRPSDVLRTRAGLSVEVGNTDAEGRLVLCDLLFEACEAHPAVLLDVATLTGAARVALGPDLPALFCDDESLAAALLDAGRDRADPLWRLPLWDGYDEWLQSSVADLNNVSSKPMAGAVTAALFLRRFVAPGVRWAHLDAYGWNDAARPGRPEGGEATGLRALFGGILRAFNLPGVTKHSGNVIASETRDLKAL